MIKFPFSKFIVKDHSMEPTFREYDRVFTYNWGKIQIGSVIVFNKNGMRLLKRVKEIDKKKLTATSDNKKVAKKEYQLKLSDVIGRVFLKY